jgi:hypothetical protein
MIVDKFFEINNSQKSQQTLTKGVDILTKIACFVKSKNIFSILKAADLN